MERSNKRARVVRQCKESATVSSTVAFSALLLELEKYKYRCEALTIETRCTSRLASKAEELRKKLARVQKVDSASKNTPKSRKNNLLLLVSVWLHSRRSLLAPRSRVCDWRGLLLARRWTLIRRVRTCKMHRYVSSKLSRRQSWLGRTWIKLENCQLYRLKP